MIRIQPFWEAKNGPTGKSVGWPLIPVGNWPPVGRFWTNSGRLGFGEGKLWLLVGLKKKMNSDGVQTAKGRGVNGLLVTCLELGAFRRKQGCNGLLVT